MSARARGRRALRRGNDGGGRRDDRRVRLREPDRPAARRPRPARGASARRSRTCSRPAGWRVHREYYVNDAGRQMDILAASVWLRYLEALRRDSCRFPPNGYRGDYVRPDGRAAATRRRAMRCGARPPSCSRGLPTDEPRAATRTLYIDAVIARARSCSATTASAQCSTSGSTDILADIRDDLADFGVRFDRWYSEQDLGDGKDGGPIDRAPGAPARARRTSSSRTARPGFARRSSATRRTASSCARTARRPTSPPTSPTTSTSASAASTCSSRRPRRRPPRLRGARARGARRDGRAAPTRCEVPLVQFVTLFTGGEKVPMGKREAQFVTLRELRTRSRQRRRALHLRDALPTTSRSTSTSSSRRSSSNDNPVYYVQYAHARIASVLKQAAERGLPFDRGRRPRGPASSASRRSSR